MQHRFLWSAAVFAAVPFLVFACGGGRSDILLLDEAGGAAGQAGKGGAAGKGGSAGQAGTAGTAGSAGATAGASGGVCVPGQQFSCACPGTSSKGVQACLPDGKGLGSCEGCPSGQGGGTGSGGKGGSAGQGQAGQGQAGSSDKPDAGDFFDSLPFPLPDSGPVGQCVGCLKDNCDSQINSCYNNPDCAQGIQCAVTQCLGGNILGGMGGGPGPGGMGGGPDLACLLGCFNGDPGAAFAAVQTFQCVTQTCGSDCGGGFFGDGGGGFPLGGLGGGPPPGMNGDPNARYIDGVRVPLPSEVPGYPWLQQALTPKQLRNRLRV